MPEYVTCPRCGCSCRVGLHHSAHCVQCFTSFRTDVACPRCGQMGHTDVCGSCREAERQPQGESMRLFLPAPTQIPGQLGFGTESELVTEGRAIGRAHGAWMMRP